MTRQELIRECDKLFMAKHRHAPCAVTTLRSWMGQPTVGHHILAKSVYPEYRYEPMNMISLAPHMHQRAHDYHKWFVTWLKRNRPEQYEWCKQNAHHRNKKKINIQEVYERLKEEQNNGKQ